MAHVLLTIVVATALAIPSSARWARDSGIEGRIATSLFQDQTRSDILVFDVANGAMRNLTQTPAFTEFSPAWSRDGRTIAFLRQASTGREEDRIYVVRHDGSGLRPVPRARKPFSASSLSWAPGGQKIAFTGQGWLWTVRLDGRGLRRLTRADNYGTSWSSDGRKIAFARGASGSKGIYLVQAKGRGLSRLTRLRRLGDLDLNPTWSPDGRTIAFERNGDGIWVMKPDGSRKHRLGGGDLGGFGPAWSPDARRIAFQPYGTSSYALGIWVMDADGSHQRQLIDTHGELAVGLSWGRVP